MKSEVGKRVEHSVYVGSEEIHPGGLFDLLHTSSSGAITSFFGRVRESSGTRGREGDVVRLEYEAYLPMAQSELEAVVTEATHQWPSSSIVAHHRVGVLQTGEIAVGIIVATPHRNDAFEACRFIIEELKKRLPIWKKEVFADGAEWVDPRP